MLFSWYYKGFELLRQYLIKHPTRVDLESLDLEVVDQEMAQDETAYAAQATADAPARDIPDPTDAGVEEVNA